MITLIIIGAIMLSIGIILRKFTDNNNNGISFFFGVIGAYILSGGMMIRQESHKPTAMDVYQGKTTLEYTVKDGVITDSVVVFKYKEK